MLRLGLAGKAIMKSEMGLLMNIVLGKPYPSFEAFTRVRFLAGISRPPSRLARSLRARR